VFLDALQTQLLDTKKFLALPEAEFLVPMMIAVNDFLLHDTIITKIRIQLNKHRSDKDRDDAQLMLLEAEVDLLNRHQFGLIWECLELLNQISREAPSITAFIQSFPELKNLYDRVLPEWKSNKGLRRMRNNLAFHFGLETLDKALATVPGDPTFIFKTEHGDNFWYQVASVAQTHLLTRNIHKMVNDTDPVEKKVKNSGDKGLELQGLKLNLLSIFLSVIAHYTEPLLLSPAQVMALVAIESEPSES